jgi:hypothetical protein
MKYALMIYNNLSMPGGAEDERREIDARIAAVLERPSVTGWVRLHTVESATTVQRQGGRTVLTDGPFVESKEYIAGVIVVEADNLDGALAIAAELQEIRGPDTGAIEVRPVRDEDLVRA